ncbi:MAG: DUF3052 family protein [Gemmatimonadaceae bacterium]|nr:DUF3052 family protein [Gemmatimonadaceae bacterium]
MPGYSGTPLARKLGFTPGAKVLVMGDVPKEYADWVAPLPAGVRLSPRGKPPHAAVHVFVTQRADLVRQLPRLRRSLAPDGYVWVSWPKKSARVATDVTEDTIREVALPLGFVDVKVCAVSEVWSGLKLVIRVSDR